MRSWRRHYGAGPGHLVLLLACFAFTGYVLTRVHQQGGLTHIVLWFVLSLVAHDLIVWPIYALADRGALRFAARRARRGPPVPWINHVRVPTVISGMLLAISFPLVLGLSATEYRDLTGLSEAPYLTHWLVVTAVLFGSSAVIYAVRVGWVLWQRSRLDVGIGAGTKSAPLDRRTPSARSAK